MRYGGGDRRISCFKLVRVVLDVLYDQMNFPTEKAKDAAIKEGFPHLWGAYEDLTTFRANYSEIATRFAYICCYTPSHADMVYQLIRDTPVLRRFFESNTEKNIACIGGGPGSEVLGMLKFLKQTGTSTTLRCSMFDQRESWEAYWQNWRTFWARWSDENWFNGTNTQFAGPRIFSSFYPLYVADSRTYIRDNQLSNVDLFTMSYFLSEIYYMQELAECFIEHLFKKAKCGSLLLFIDSCAEKFNCWRWFDALARKHGMEIIDGGNEHPFRVEFCEEKRDLQRFYTKFVETDIAQPKLSDPITYRICCKVRE